MGLFLYFIVLLDDICESGKRGYRGASDTKKPAGVRILWRGGAGVVVIRMIQPSGIDNHNLTFKPVFYRVYQNLAPPAIASSGRRPWNGAFLFGEKITTFVTSYRTFLTDKVTRGTKNLQIIVFLKPCYFF